MQWNIYKHSSICLIILYRSKVEAGMKKLAEHRVGGETFLGRALSMVSY